MDELPPVKRQEGEEKDGAEQTGNQQQRLQQAGFRMAIVSNKADPAVQLIRTLYFDGIIDVAVGESPACSKKPYILLKYAEQKYLNPRPCRGA